MPFRHIRIKKRVKNNFFIVIALSYKCDIRSYTFKDAEIKKISYSIF